MDKDTRELLNERICTEFSNLDSVDVGSDEYCKISDNLIALYKLKIEESKVDTQYDENLNRRQMDDEHFKADLEINRDKMKDQRNDKLIDLGAQLGITLLGILSYDLWFRKCLRFEESGTFVSPVTKNLLSKMLPKK